MERTVQNPLTPEDVSSLSEACHGFWGPPEPGDLKEAMSALDPSRPDDLTKLEALKTHRDALDNREGKTGQQLAAARVDVARAVRHLLDLPQSRSQDEDEWRYVHPSAL